MNNGRRVDGAERDEPGEAARGALKGRGTVWAIQHRYSSQLTEAYDDGWGTLDQQASEERLAPATTVIEERAKSILSRNDSPDISFDQSINPYRGCEHGCIYCFARPTHSYLNLSPGLDFETRIIAKVNAAERLREAFAQPRPTSPTAQHRLGHRRLPAGRAQAAHHALGDRGAGRMRASVRAGHQVVGHRARPRSGRADGAARPGGGLRHGHHARPALARMLEPRAASPPRRLRTIQALARAGVPVGVSVAPMIPFINEPELERVLEAARAAGAQLGLRHRAAAAVGGEPAVPAVAGAALSRPRRARDGARARDARRQGLRRELRHPHEGRGRLGAAAGPAPSTRRRRAAA